MKINARFVLLGIGFWMALVGMLSCASTNEDVSSSGAVATMDQTATAASVIIEAALSTTPLPFTRVSNIGSSAPDKDATKTVEALNIATAVAATLTAQPIATPTLDLAVTETIEAERMATSVAATLTAQPTPTLDQAVTQTRLAHFLETSVAATLTAQPIATDTPAASRQVVAYRANEQALQELSSLWNLTTFRDLYAPGLHTYNVSITPNQDWRWSFAWCAINSKTLGEILQPVTVTLLVDERVLPNSDILQHQAVSSNGDQCFYWSTGLKNWQLDTIVKLEVRYSLASAINDGRQNYSAGQYQQVMFVNVR